jgi:hypothetical protein
MLGQIDDTLGQNGNLYGRQSLNPYLTCQIP